MTEKELQRLYKLLDDNAPQLVGELLSDIETLKGESLTFDQLKNIIKKIVKEHVYQNSRQFKRVCKAYFEKLTIQFESRENK